MDKEQRESKEKYCKRVMFDDGFETPKVIYGIILKETENIIKVKTANRVYLLNKKSIIAISDTNKVYRGEDE